jgi:hypothetical protein
MMIIDPIRTFRGFFTAVHDRSPRTTDPFLITLMDYLDTMADHINKIVGHNPLTRTSELAEQTYMPIPVPELTAWTIAELENEAQQLHRRLEYVREELGRRYDELSEVKS